MRHVRGVRHPSVAVSECLLQGLDEQAFALVNDGRFGLQAGVFTRDLGVVQAAFDRLEVGAVLVNEVPTWRSDAMPYGGVKDSGFGREGVRYAIEEMTERRTLVLPASPPWPEHASHPRT